jgi:RND family efflux transporter MFP subunit
MSLTTRLIAGPWISILTFVAVTQVPPDAPQTARVETAPLELVAPDRYQVPVVFEPDRRVALKATDDGIILALPAQMGEMVRSRQELVRLDMAEAMARLKIAQAEVKERSASPALLATDAASKAQGQVAQAQLEAAQARQELAQLAVERCALKAPFDGLLLDYPVSIGQYVPKGTTVADLADVSRLRVRIPIDRASAKLGDSLPLEVAGATVPGKIEAILPLPESFSPLRELATNWAVALVRVDNPDGRTYLPGQRVRAPLIPTDPVSTVAARAIQQDGTVQVLRNEHVASVPVRVLGPLGLDRSQVTGPFHSGDVVIVASSVPLAEGTFIRFGGDTAASSHGLELTPPDPTARGSSARVQPPARSAPATSAPATSVAPIGQPDSAAPRRSTTPAPATRPATPAAPRTAPGNASPF